MVPDPNNIPLGFLGNLSTEQERCLQQLWSLVLYLENAASFNDLEHLFRVNSVERNKSISISSFARRNSLLTRTDSILLRRSSTASFPAPSNPLLQTLSNIGMTASEIRSVAKSLTYLSPDDVRWGILTASKQEYPDRWMLRYLRFCKWNVNKAFILILNALQWRIKDMHVDDRLLPEGELGAIHQSQAPLNAAEAQQSRGFLSQLQMGKCYVHGVDRLNRPLCDTGAAASTRGSIGRGDEPIHHTYYGVGPASHCAPCRDSSMYSSQAEKVDRVTDSRCRLSFLI